MSYYSPNRLVHPPRDGSGSSNDIHMFHNRRSRSSTPQKKQYPLTPQQQVTPLPLGGSHDESRARDFTPNRSKHVEYQRRIPPRRFYPSEDHPGRSQNHTLKNQARGAEAQPYNPLGGQQEEYYYTPQAKNRLEAANYSTRYESTAKPRYASHDSNSERRRHESHNLGLEQRQAYSPYSRSNPESFRQLERLRAEQREDQYQLQLMQERESEIAEINEKVKTVNEIYKDLAELIDGQQDLIDKIDISLEEGNAYTKAGINNYEEARLRFENPILEDPFGDKLGKPSRHSRPGTPRDAGRRRVRGARHRTENGNDTYSDNLHEFDCRAPFETIQDDLREVLRDVKSFGSKIVLACTAPNVSYNEYATYR